MGYNFEVFKRTTRARPRDTEIMIYRTGNMRLSRPAYEVLGCPKSVDLLFVPGRRIFGIRPSDGPDAYAVNISQTVSSRAFLTANELIPADACRRYIGRMQDGVLVFGDD